VVCAGPRLGLLGETNPAEQVIVLYVRPHGSLRRAARVYAHELGHAYDFALLTDDDRLAWMAQRGLTGDWGNTCPSGQLCDDLARPAGDWAEAVGEVLVPATGMWACLLGDAPTDDEAALLRSILARHGVAIAI
jgi:hypothetical protein